MTLDVLDAPAPAAAPGTYPVPPGRGRWRLTVHRRSFSAARWDQTIIAELTGAYSRQLVQKLGEPAELRFSIDGRSDDAATVQELQHDVFAWRWDDTRGSDVCMFRGPVDHSQDTISQQAHTVNFVVHDYFATLERRFILDALPIVLAGYDQDALVGNLLARAGGGATPFVPYQPGSIIPLSAVIVDPSGAGRARLGATRDRTYQGGKSIGEAIDELSKVSGGFDYDVIPEPQAADTLPVVDQTPGSALGTLGPGRDALRIFYPSRGITRTDMALIYGGNVSTVSRTVNSSDYANYIRSLGNNAATDPNAAQLIGVAANSDAATAIVGWWPFADSAPSDVNQQATLDQRAAGLLASMGVLVPSYTIDLRPGTYVWGTPNIGDSCPLVIRSGRLAVNTTVRVVGITYDVGDDGEEDVEITVGRSLTSLADLLARTNTAVASLGRR